MNKGKINFFRIIIMCSVLLLMIGLFLPLIWPTKANLERAQKDLECRGRLKDLYISYLYYACDHDGLLPPLSDQKLPCPVPMVNQATMVYWKDPDSFHCPHVHASYPREVSSYTLVGYPATDFLEKLERSEAATTPFIRDRTWQEDGKQRSFHPGDYHNVLFLDGRLRGLPVSPKAP